MVPIQAKKNDTLEQEARHWLSVMHSGAANDAEKQDFEAWIAQGPDHEGAYYAAEQVWQDMGPAAEVAGIDVDALLKEESAARGMVAWICVHPPVYLGAIAAVLLLVAVSFMMFTQAPTTTYSTQIAEIKEITLDDGSRVMLGARSEIETHFTDDARQVKLIAGEAFFDVNKDNNRAFFVAAGGARVRVLGTRFDVKRSLDNIHVVVVEGVVEVAKTDSNSKSAVASIAASVTADKKILTAGQRIVVPAASDYLAAIEQGGSSTWQTGRLVYESATLAEIIADMNRYHPREIRVGDTALADIRLTTAFDVKHVGRMLETLAASQPILLDYQGKDTIIVRTQK